MLFFKVRHLHLALKLISVQIHSKYDNMLKKQMYITIHK